MNIAASEFHRGVRLLLLGVLLSGNLLAGGCAGDKSNATTRDRESRNVVFVPSDSSSRHWTQPGEGVSDAQGAANAAGSAALSGLLYTASLFGHQDRTQPPDDEAFQQTRQASADLPKR